MLAMALGGGAGAYGAQRIRAARVDRRERAVELEGVRRLADEDVTVFGEQLQRLGDEVASRELDQETRDDYQGALDAYERAKWDAPGSGRSRRSATWSTPSPRAATHSRASGRAVAGGPVPELRVPCFFNPQHGPSAAT